MKIQDLIEPNRGSIEITDDDNRTDSKVDIVVIQRIKCRVVSELNNLLGSLGHNINSYLYPDEVALLNCIVRLGLQDDSYFPTATVEKLAIYLQAKAELNRTLA